MSREQLGVLGGMAVAMTITVVAIMTALDLRPEALLPRGPFPETLAAALQWDVLIVACLAATIGNLARHRFFTPEDIAGGGLSAGTPRARVFQAVLQNTLEQSVLAIGVHAVWSAATQLSAQAVVPVAAILFVAGRILFALGYARGAPARALGFGLTFYPSVLMLVLLAFSFLDSRFG